MRHIRALIRHLPADAAVWRHTAARTPKPRRETSTPARIRAVGGRFVHVPKTAGT